MRPRLKGRNPVLVLVAAVVSLSSCDDPAKVSGSAAGIATASDTTDADGDGFPSAEDCDDLDAAHNPSAVEVCDGVDNDCDGEVDEEVQSTWYLDADQDGFGDPLHSMLACAAPSEHVTNAADCDDTDPRVFPGAAEACNGVDDDCNNLIDEDVQEEWFADNDADGFGDALSPILGCDAPDGAVADGTDCDDGRDSVFPGAPETCNEVDDDCDGSVDEGMNQTFYQDLDGDGWGDVTAFTEACSRPVGYADVPGDCDDLDASVHPDAPEPDCADPKDYNCDGSVAYADADGDGWAACTECNDADPAVHPGALEVCNGVDDDCNGATDDGDPGVDLATGGEWYGDVDGDGFGNPTDVITACAAPSGYVGNDADCDDGAPAVHPLATEVCNTIDDDCDGDIDDADSTVDLSTGTTWYVDGDGDGFGDPGRGSVSCAAPAQGVMDNADCDDGNVMVFPGALEVCNTIDDDCDGLTDDADASLDLASAGWWYADVDGDGHGDAAVATQSCVQPASTSALADDCNDSMAAVFPGASEVCNGIDDDCDARIDDADASLDTTSGTLWHVDADGDGFGSPTVTVAACVAPSGTTTDATDCDDGAVAVFPGANEVCNAIDDDCDGAIDDADGSLDTTTASTWYVDGDGDGYGGSAVALACVQPSGSTAVPSDCNDSDSRVNPGAVEACDGVDTDCDGSVDEGYSAVTVSVGTTSPSGSCNGNSNRAVTFSAASACGCPVVTLSGAFYDYSDGSGGQLTSVSASTSSMSLQWDDSPSGGDCDLDIRSSISWSASYAAGTLSITVSDSITGYDAGNSLGAGYSISSYSTVLRSSGSGSATYTYTCP